MLKIKNPERLNITTKALTADIHCEIVYQRENAAEYLFRILKDGVLDAKMTISKDWNVGDTVVVRFCDKDNHWIHSTYDLDYEMVSNRSKFIFWITERFLDDYKQ